MTQQLNTLPLSQDLDFLFELMVGPTRMAVLETAIIMKLPDILETTQEPKKIAKILKLKANESNLIYFLDAMTALGFVGKENGTYTNTPFSKSYLLTTSPTYLGGMVNNISQMQHRNLFRIPELIVQGPPKLEIKDKLDREEKWKESARHLANYQKAGMAKRVASLISSLPEYPSIQRMLDLGCGPGIMCMEVVSNHPTMEGYLCDMPPLMEVAQKEIAAAGLETRMHTIAGDYNKVDFGHNYDLIWTSQTLYYVKDFSSMFSRIYNALNPGGLFLSLHEGLACERTQPSDMVLSRLSLALEGQDVSFEQGEIASYLHESGFYAIEIRIMDLPFGPAELTIARKSR
ncbi:methyltransferase domain-containing protein [Maridesulfovibrio sp.]|uniref:methyltransferase domain-containing protein n=1 Tax=Maridesulfovibrio sp. TaxID=2795000 RepID=UPI003BA886A5